MISVQERCSISHRIPTIYLPTSHLIPEMKFRYLIIDSRARVPGSYATIAVSLQYTLIPLRSRRWKKVIRSIQIQIYLKYIWDLVVTSFQVIRVQPLFDYLGAIYYTCQIASLFVTSYPQLTTYTVETAGASP